MPGFEKDEELEDPLLTSPADDEILLFSPEMRQMFYQDDSGTGTFKGSIANLVNSAIGAGVLGLPFAFQQAGMFCGILLAIFFCPLITFTLHIMGRAQKLANEGSLQNTCEKLLGYGSKVVIIVLQLTFIIGACIGFLTIIADNLEPQFKQWAPNSHIANRRVIILLSLIPITPMCFIRNIQKISPLATFSIMAIVYTLGMMIVRAATKLAQEGMPPMQFGEIACGPGNQPPNCNYKNSKSDDYCTDIEDSCFTVSSFRQNVSVLKALPIFCFAYNVHCTHSLVFAEMAKPKTLTKMDKASALSLVFCAVVYIICGLVGYWYTVASEYPKYLDNIPSKAMPGVIPGNALLLYPPDIDVAIARICIAISVVGSFTTLHFSGFHCWQDLLIKAEPGQKAEFTEKQAVIERVCFIGGCTGVALIGLPLDLILDLTGAIAIVPMMFCFPGLLQLKLHEIVNKGEHFPITSPKARFWGYFLVVFGVVLASASLVVIILGKTGVIKT